MHPWRGIGFLERKEKADQMRDWLRANPALRIKNGTKRDDGKVFCGYGVGYANGEHWSSDKVLENNRDICRKKMRELRKSPYYKQQFNIYAKKRYAQNEDVRQQMKARVDKWAAEHKSRLSQHASNRRALKRNQLHPDHDFEIEAKMHEQARLLTITTGIEHHVDHIIPIKHGGWHHHKNLQVLPEGVNLGKSCDPFWKQDGFKSFRDVPQALWPEQLVDEYLAIQTS